MKRIDVIVTTFPIATAVLIGLILHLLTGRPWVIDFRDSMTEDHYPSDPLTHRVYRWIERQAIRHGSRFLFTAPSTLAMYLKRYPSLRASDCLVISNGYDEDDFAGLHAESCLGSTGSVPIRIVHAGIIYPSERDPRAFFSALSRLKAESRVNAASVRIELRASGSEGYFSKMLSDLNIEDIVHLLPPLPYREALCDCAEAHALLLFQAASCNHQIPAKAYEYLRLGKPILALTHPSGDTAALLSAIEGSTIVDLADESALYAEIPKFLNSVGSGLHPRPDAEKVRRYTRRRLTHELAAHLDALVPPKSQSKAHPARSMQA